jgi:3-hydroxy-3-methylglutaryl CoA synthase
MAVEGDFESGTVRMRKYSDRRQKVVGITSYGAYIPYYRLNRAEIAKVWGGPTLRGEKAVASYDEDSLTLAVAAAQDCLRGINLKSVDRLYFASVTCPYKEKQAAATIATVVDLNRESLTVDFSNSLRSGTNAITAAIDAISSGSAKSVLVCAADNRLGYPAGAMEMLFGDGAAAVLVGTDRIIATIEASYTLFDEILDVWRTDKDLFVHAWEDRFIVEEGYSRVVQQAISSALKKYSLSTKDFSKVVLYAPDLRQLSMVARKLGFDLKTQVQDNLYNSVGNTGSASALMSLVAALEEAKAGERILLVSYGNGCDVFILKVTDEIEKTRNRRGIKGHLAVKQMLSSYQKYLRWRDLVETEPPQRPDLPKPSAPALWRDTRGGLALYGVKCKHCGAVQYPAQRICMVCHTKDSFVDYRFADKVGKVLTFTQDSIAFHPDPPVTMAAVDFPEGGRILCDMTDYTSDEIKIRMPVEMTFRKLHYVGGFYNYWWKCRPLRF